MSVASKRNLASAFSFISFAGVIGGGHGARMI